MGKKLYCTKQLKPMILFARLSKLLLDLSINQRWRKKPRHYEKLYRTMKIPIRNDCKFYTQLKHAPYIKPPD